MSNETKKTALPKLRFSEFREAGEWEFANGNKLFDQITNKNHNSDLPILAITQEHGAIPRELIDYNVVVTEKSVESYKVVEKGDFIISLRSFQGGIEYSTYKGICSPAYIILRQKKDGPDAFFKQYFKTPAFIGDLNKNIEGLRDGKMVSYKQFSDLFLPTPSIPEQQKIAATLSSLDDLLTAQSAQLAALQAHKRGLLQGLFPAEGETVPKLRFPEFQQAPEWNSRYILDLAQNSLTNGVFNDPKKVGSGYKLVNVSDMYIDSFVDETRLSLVNITTKEFIKNKVEHGDIFFTRSSLVPAGIAASNIYLGVSNDITFDGHLIRLRPNTNIVFPLFLHYLLKTENVRSQLIAKGKRATMTTIGQSDVATASLSFPNLKEQHKIADCLLSLDERITAQTQKIEALKLHKKGLMQGLFPAAAEPTA